MLIDLFIMSLLYLHLHMNGTPIGVHFIGKKLYQVDWEGFQKIAGTEQKLQMIKCNGLMHSSLLFLYLLKILHNYKFQNQK